MASLKALLKRLTGLRGGRYSLGNYITLTVNTEYQTAAQDGLLMLRHNSAQTDTADCILMVNTSAAIDVSRGQDIGIIPVSKGDSFCLWTSSATPQWVRFIPWVEK